MTPDYEGYELLSEFTPEQLKQYRTHLLAKTAKQTDFIRRHVGEAINVMELASGNGRLLIDLARQNILSCGLGIELSKSRYNFAVDWDGELELSSLAWVRGDVRDCTHYGYYDLAVLITGAAQYFQAEDLKRVLKYMRTSAKHAIFELYKRPKDQKTWHRLNESDRYSYILDHYTTENPTTHTKYFIKRTGSVDVRIENLHYYSMQQFLGILYRAGFKNVHWAREDDQLMVVLVS